MASAASHEPRPLASWKFAGEFRRSQQLILDEVYPMDGAPEPGDPLHGVDPLHIVAPPGSGKTLVGLELARRHGHRALVLSPTTTIRAQWGRSARALAAGTWGEHDAVAPAGAVSESPEELGDFTALTYQMLSVLETVNPFDALAISEWERELVEAGRTAEAARWWIAELSESNRPAYRSGLQRRARRLRKEVVRADATALEAALHPNARALIDRLVEHGIQTIVLDECHHLLDHWAVVVHCLLARIRATGVEPLLIGLTATLPSLEDRDEYENYTGLLGEVDYELPTPAVVKEGNLAPYRDLAWFVTPTEDELFFLRTHEASLEVLIEQTLRGAGGQSFVEYALFGASVTPNDTGADRRVLELQLAEAFKRDHEFAEACVRMLLELAPQHPVRRLVHASARTRATTDQRIRVLARFALERLLPDPEQAQLWVRTKSVLADFGYHLTDRGIRRGRDPLDQILATSEAKDHAVVDILRHELAGDSGSEVRAVVILDFAQHGHRKSNRGTRAGALRCFRTVVHAAEHNAPDLQGMHPVLVTSKHLQIAQRDAAVLVPRLAALTGVHPVAVPTEDPAVVELELSGVGSAAIVAAVSHLVSDGVVRLIIGTRGLLGEGWDCPQVNTLIDLSSVATSASTQQLRGRTLRLDPAWPEKVAHNWTVTSVIEAGINIDGNGDVARLERKHSRVWGIALDGPTAVVRGLEHTLTDVQGRELGKLLMKQKGATSAVRLNELTLSAVQSRAETLERWGIGEPYVGEVSYEGLLERPEGTPSFLSAITLEATLFALFTLVAAIFGSVGVTVLRGFEERVHPVAIAMTGAIMLAFLLWATRRDFREVARSLRRRALPASDYQGAVLALSNVLHAQGKVREMGRANIQVATFDSVPMGKKQVVATYEVRVHGASGEEQREVLSAMEELFAPVRSPRFLLKVSHAGSAARSPLYCMASKLAALFGDRSRLLAVPKGIGRRQEYARQFASEWTRHVGPCTLHEIDSPEKLALLTKARNWSATPDTPPRHREVWA